MPRYQFDSQAARRAALIGHSRHDPRVTSYAGRQAFLERFEREVDPDGTLPPDERARRAARAKKAYFIGLAQKSAKVRRANRVQSA